MGSNVNIEILKTNNYSINLRSDYTNKEKLNEYYPTFNNMRMLEKFLLYVENKINGSIILSGAYGTGKSYFTALFTSILGSDLKYEDYSVLLEKAKNVYNISDSLKRAKEKNYLIVFVDESMENFSEGVFSGLRKALKEKNIDIEISTKIDIIEAKLNYWKENHKNIYNNFKLELDKNSFYKELEYKTKKVEKIFSEVYSNQFGGEKFSYSGEIKNIKKLLEEVELELEKNGYSGIVYVFDEFGRYLETNINNIDVKEIQDMAEYCNLENNSNFLLITHKDIFQYTRKLKNTSEREEWEKVSGRFLKEHLIFEKTSILQILKNIIQKNNYDEYRKDNNNIKLKETLLEALIPQNVKEYTKDFYPLDYITAFSLPDLSQKLAQNERTLFAFICSDDSNGLRSLIFDSNTKREFITIDYLYDYFEREIKQLPVDSLEYKVYISSRDAISRIPKDDENNIRIIKALAMIYINNNFAEIEPNIETLRYIFNKENLDLSFLEENRYIVLNKYKNYYKILERADLDIEKKIEEYCEKKIGRFDYIARLEKEMYKGNYYPLKYNDLNKINRYLGQYFVDVSNISKLEELKENYREDGRIIYLTNIEGNENYSKIKEALKEKNDYILVSSKENKLEIYQELKELEAIALIYENEKVEENEALRIEIEIYKKEIKNEILKKMNLFFNENIDLIEITNDYLNKKYPKYIGINYELINRRNISSPMKKARYEILKKIAENRELKEEYFNDTKAESSVARILIKNTGIYDKDIDNEKYLEFNKLMSEILEDIKENSESLEKIYRKYCSNLGDYGIREGLFTFLLGIVCIENKDQIVVSFSEEKGELNFSIDIFELLEKNPEKYKIAYYKITEEEIKYLENLEQIVAKYVKKNDSKISNRILDGIKNYLLNQPRYINTMYLPSLKGLNKIYKRLFTIGGAEEFLLKDLPNIYRTDNYKILIDQFNFEISSLEESKNSFVENLEKETVKILSKEKLNNLKKYVDSLSFENIDLEIELYLESLKELSSEEILKNLTKRIKGFSYDNWRGAEDLEEFIQLLEKETSKVKKEKIEDIDCLKIQFKGNEEIIELGEITDTMEKMLSSKILADIKNMGFSLTVEQKKKVIAKILLDMKG